MQLNSILVFCQSTRSREKDVLIEKIKKNIKKTIADFSKSHNEIDVNKETTNVSALPFTIPSIINSVDNQIFLFLL